MSFPFYFFDNQIESQIAIIYLHENSLNTFSFEKQLRDEKLSVYRQIALDFPGCGQSPKDEKYYSFMGLGKVVKNLIDELELDNVVLVGHSLGGHVAIEMLPDVDQIKGVFVFGAPPLTSPPDLDAAFLPHPSLSLMFSGNLTDEQSVVFGSGFTKHGVTDEMVASIRATDPNFRTKIFEGTNMGCMHDEIEILKKTDVPVAVLHGEEDALVNLDYITDLEINNLWNDRIYEIEGAGHCLQLEDAPNFNMLLLRFVEDLGKYCEN